MGRPNDCLATKITESNGHLGRHPNRAGLRRDLPAQLQPFVPNATGLPQKSYTDYYMESVQSYKRPPVNVRDYTIDKYYYHNPNLSPYLNLTRWRGVNSINNYYHYVLPEVNRRSSGPRPTGPAGPAPVLPPQNYPMTGPIHTPVPLPSPSTLQTKSPYFNNYYGNYGASKK